MEGLEGGGGRGHSGGGTDNLTRVGDDPVPPGGVPMGFESAGISLAKNQRVGVL